LAALSGASTYALGEVFQSHFESGGTFLDFDVTRLKRMYDEKFEKGKEMAEEINKEQQVKETKAKAAEKDKLQRIKELSELKEKGHLTAAEFDKLKFAIIEG